MSQKPSENRSRKRNEGDYGDGKLVSHFKSRDAWTVLQQWIFELPAENDSEIKHNVTLQRELDRFAGETHKGNHNYENVSTYSNSW